MTGRDPAEESGKRVWQRAKESVIAHYEGALEQHGPTAEGMEWKDEASQQLRFRILSQVCDLSGKSVHEIGAGAGRLCDFLEQEGISSNYSGSDVSPAMVQAAGRLHPGVSFERRDILLDPDPARYDIVLASGVFNVRKNASEREWGAYLRASVRRMYEMCEEATAFNLMSDHVDYRVDALYYANAGEMLDFCRRELSRFVVLRHDYPLYEYTIYVYRRSERG